MPEYIDQPENRIGATFVLQKKHDDISCLYRYTMVMGSIDRIFEEAVQLPQDQRLELAYRLLVSNEPAADKDLEGEWDTAICERIERYEKGEGRRRLAGEVFSDLDKRLTK